jgi:hypothetical protein
VVLKVVRFLKEFRIEAIVACAFALQGCLVIINTGSYSTTEAESRGPDPLSFYGALWNSTTSKQEVFRIEPSTGEFTKIVDLTTAHNTNWDQIVLMNSSGALHAIQVGSASGFGSGSGTAVGYGLGSGSFLSIDSQTLSTNNFVVGPAPNLVAIRANGDVIASGKSSMGTQTVWRINLTTRTSTALATHSYGNFNYQSAIDQGTDRAYFTGVGAGAGSASIFLHQMNLQNNSLSSAYVAGIGFTIAGVKDASTLIIVRWNSSLSRMEVRELNVNTLSESYIGDMGDLSTASGPTSKAILDANGWVIMIGRNASSVTKIYAFDINRAQVRTTQIPSAYFATTLIK